MNRRDDEALLQSLFDRTISPTDFEQLEARLHDDPELRRVYYEYCNLEHSLTEEYEVHRFNPARSNSTPNRRPLLLAVASAVVILVAMLAVARFTALRPAPPQTHVVFGPEANGAIHHAGDDGPATSLIPGSRVELLRGTAELTLATGVRVVIEGRTTLESIAANEVRLDNGRAWFRIPEGAEGFTCHSGGLRIIDLGTEFGLIAAPGDTSEIHVLEGSVRAVTPGPAPATRDLSKGDAVAWSGGELVDTPHFSGFTKDLLRPKLVFHENFKSPRAPLDGRQPARGPGPWKSLQGDAVIHDDALDTSGNPNLVFAPLDLPLGERDHVLLLTLKTRNPRNYLPESDGWAGVSLFTGETEQIFIGDPVGPGTNWSVHPPGDHKFVSSAGFTETHTVTLRYDFLSGRVDLYAGADSRGQPLVSARTAPGLAFDQIRIANGDDGDIAIESLTITILASDSEGANPMDVKK